MTYKEMMERDHPEEINQGACGGVVGCPHDYYGIAPRCTFVRSKDMDLEEACTACWNREADSTDDAPQEKPKTNGDRIRAMSDEELAKWVVCPFDTCGCMPPYDGNNCEDCVHEWLKQPAEEGSE